MAHFTQSRLLTKSGHPRLPSFSLAILTLLFSATAHAGDLSLEFSGTVTSNTFQTNALASFAPGAASTLNFEIDLEAGGVVSYSHIHVNCGLTPNCVGSVFAQNSVYPVDLATWSFSIGGTPLGPPTTNVDLRITDNFGLADKIDLFSLPLTGGDDLVLRFSPTSDFLVSGDLSIHPGTTSLVPFSGFRREIQVTGPDLGGTTTASLLITLEEIVVGSVFPLSCHGDSAQASCGFCPCSNNAPIGTLGGCTNSNGSSALLVGSGNPSVAADTLRFSVRNSVPQTFGILQSGSTQPASPGCTPGSGITSPNGNGLRCIIGLQLRHGVRRSDSDGAIVLSESLAGVNNPSWGGDGGSPASLISQAGFAAGQVRHFQFTYREPVTFGCQSGLGSSNAVSVTILP